MAEADARFGFEWMDATVEWLLTLFNLTRLGVALWGAVGLLSAVGNVIIYLEGPPSLTSPFMPMVTEGQAFCWLSPDPNVTFLLSLIYLAPSIGAMVLVWRLPRTGFLLSASGWVLFWVSAILHGHGFESPVDWRWFLLWLAVPCLWLAFAAWKLAAKGRILHQGKGERPWLRRTA